MSRARPAKPSAPAPFAALTLIGAGGHALVVAEAATLAGYEVLGVYDDDPDAVACQVQRLRHLGPLSEGPGRRPRAFVLALGDLKLRRRVIKTLDGRAAARVIHPQSVVHASARIGAGVYIGPAAVVHSFARIDPHAIINSGAIVEHECLIGENAHIAPGAVLGGRVRVGPDTLIGLGARVLPNLTIGRGCTIGAGAVVVRDVPDRATLTGVPARRR